MNRFWANTVFNSFEIEKRHRTQIPIGINLPDKKHKLAMKYKVVISKDEKSEYQVTSTLEKIDPKIKGVDISVSIVFGHSIESLIESNIAPFDFVKEGKLVVDESTNKMSYGSDAIVVNISALSLKELWKKEGDRGLLAMNLRYYIKNKNIDNKITNSILDDYEKFWYLNNGIIIVCDSFEFSGDELKMRNFSIVNG